MLDKIRRVLATLALGFLIFSTSFAQAGDIINFLPEVLQARSGATFSQNLLSAAPGDMLAVCEQELDFSQLPDHYLIDQNGRFHSQAEISQITAELFCLVFNLSVANIDILKLLNGEVIEVVNAPVGDSPLLQLLTGQMIDGRKQAIRFVASRFVDFDLFYELRDFNYGQSFKVNIDSHDSCATVKGWVHEGATFELKYTAFLALRLDQSLTEFLNVSPNNCSVRMDQTQEELIQQAKDGNIDAAISLSVVWSEGLPSLREGSDLIELEQVQSDIAFFELLILQNTGKHPLLTMAAIKPLDSLYLLESLFSQEEF